MSHDPKQQTNLIRDYLDGSLPPEQASEAERIIESDPSACTIPSGQDKLETFIGRLQEALAMPPFPSEQNDRPIDRVRQAVSEQMQQSPSHADDTAGFTSNDPSLPSAPPADAAQHPALPFLSPPQSADEIGRLNGYRVLRQLGEGGMGLVFEAEDIRLKRRVALKVMKPEVAAKEHNRARFIREAETAAKVEHDHICPIYQVGEENGVPFIAMPFLKGEALDARLKRQKPLPIADAVRIGLEIAAGLAAAHEAGLVHRDIKPGNVWLEEDRPGARKSAALARSARVRILDFGLARLAADDMQLTQSGAIMGTPSYMAPEQARSKPVDHRADLFSLGVMLYEMTTGRRPFTGGDTMSILTSLAIDIPTAPNQVNPAIPAVLSDLISKLLSKLPEERPADGHVVAEALLAILAQSARPIVEAMSAPALGAPLATAADATAVDPWQAIDESSPPAAPVATAAPATSSKSQKSRGKGVWIALALALLALGGGGFAAYTLFFQTKDGTLVVDVEGEADVRFKNGKLLIYDAQNNLKYTLMPQERTKAIAPGSYKVAVSGADGVQLETEEFVMTKDGFTVRVKAVPAPEVRQFALCLDQKSDRVTFEGLKVDLQKPGCCEFWVEQRGVESGVPLLLTGENQCLYFQFGGGIFHVTAVPKIGDSGNKSRCVTVFTKQVPAGMMHVAGSWSGNGDYRLYVNGNRADSKYESAYIYSKAPHSQIIPDPAGKPNEGFFALRRMRLSSTDRYQKEFTPQPQFDKDSSTIALYRFDEGQGDKLADSSGNGHDGNITGGKWARLDGNQKLDWAQLAPWSDIRQFALYLNHRNDSVAFPTLQVDLAKPGCCEFWLEQRRIAVSGPLWLVGKDQCLYFQTGVDGSLQMVAVPKIVDLVNKSDSVNCVVNKLPSGPIHVAGSWSGDGDFRLFVNGKPADYTYKSSYVFPKLAQSRIIPREPRDPTAGPEAPIDEFLALRQLRLSNLMRYTTDFTPAERLARDDSTVALYRVDEGEGDKLTDSSGNGHHGKITGGRWVKLEGNRKIDWNQFVPSADPDRKAAEYVLSIGGDVRVNGEETVIKAMTQLPKSPFQLTSCFLAYNQKVTDQGLSVFKDCINLTVLSLRNTNVTDIGLEHFKNCKDLVFLSLEDAKVSDGGMQYFKDCAKLIQLDLIHTDVGDAGLAHFKECRELKRLFLNQTQVSDAGLENFGQCKKLEDLYLGRTKVTGRGLALFKDCENLRSLDVEDLPVDDNSLAPFKDRKHLISINLSGTKATDEGLALFKACEDLSQFHLNNIKITDASLKHFKNWKKAASIQLTKADVSDAGLAHLKDCKELKELGLYLTKVTDAGLKHLKECPNLALVDARQTKVTAAGIDELRKALPRCKILWDGGVVEPAK